MQESMAISFVLCSFLQVFTEKVTATKGGEGLLRSSTVQEMSLKLSTTHSCLHQDFL